MYCDDILACFENISGYKAEEIEIKFNLSTGEWKPYNKPDNNPLYSNINCTMHLKSLKLKIIKNALKDSLYKRKK